MKKGLLSVALAFATTVSFAQSLSVSDFHLLDTDLTAITNGTMEIDQNGEVAACIKIVTTKMGFTFDIGMLGIVRTKQAVGEIWVYVPKRTQKISIFHQEYGILRNYYLPVPIESGRTYELILKINKEYEETEKEPNIKSEETESKTKKNTITGEEELVTPIEKDFEKNNENGIIPDENPLSSHKELSEEDTELQEETSTETDEELTYEAKLELAEQGDSAAQYNVGIALYYGVGTKQNLEEAVVWFTKAAQSGYLKAHYDLAVCYDRGNGVERNQVEAIEFYKKALAMGDNRALNKLAKYYEKEKEVTLYFDQMVSNLKEEALSGDKQAQYRLGFCYENGVGVEQNYKEAYNLYNQATLKVPEAAARAAFLLYQGAGTERNLEKVYRTAFYLKTLNNPEGMYLLGLLYYKGDNYYINKSYKTAFKWFEKAAQLGNTDAMCALGDCYLQGTGTKKDLEKYFEWYGKAMLSEDENDAIFSLGIKANNSSEKIEEIRHSFVSALQGNEEEQLYLGHLFYEEEHAFRNENFALYWFQKAAEQENVDAEAWLGHIYIHTNEKKAFRWYQSAADKGSLEALYQLGYLYQHGIGTKKSLSKGFSLYKEACEQGHIESMFQIGECYRNGWSVKKDLTQALEWYQKAADAGHAKACFEIGKLEEEAEHYSEAVKWYMRASEKEYADAKALLGDMYMKGIGGLEQNSETAFRLYMKAAELGSELADWRIAKCYLSGNGVEKDLEKGYEWLKKETKRDNRDAYLLMGYCYAKGWGVTQDKEEANHWYSKAKKGGRGDYVLDIEQILKP